MTTSTSGAASTPKELRRFTTLYSRDQAPSFHVINHHHSTAVLLMFSGDASTHHRTLLEAVGQREDGAHTQSASQRSARGYARRERHAAAH
ncbi:hypothetical protein EYF80_059547 [Liparis tanakae]|uniref:Uncharacterized protein n=1 Tax=Liparis tanakae TaxID=230148 RepID=A0A4Z2EP21_9TELE|nr:hypothetical protein EYF80_059547 [Liparis tanakae]